MAMIAGANEGQIRLFAHFKQLSVIGWKGNTSRCDTCHPSHLDVSGARRLRMPMVKKLKSNMKGHSYLQRFPLPILPNIIWKNHKDLTFKLLQRMAEHFYDLFHTGFAIKDQQWHGACIGSKGDLKWFSAICNLTRGCEMKSTTRDVPCCHYCLAGGPGLPAEDVYLPTSLASNDVSAAALELGQTSSAECNPVR